MKDKPHPSLAAGSRDGSKPLVRYWFAGKLDEKLTPGVVIHEDGSPDLPEQETRLGWRRGIGLYNTLQALPGVLLMTRRGLEGRDYDSLSPADGGRGASGAQQAANSAAWDEVLRSLLEDVRSGAASLVAAGVAPPDCVGYEHPGEAGVLAEAELAWIEKRVVVIL